MVKRTAEVDLDDLLRSIQEDPKFKKFREIVKNVRTKLRVEADRQEAMSLLANRSSRTLHSDRKQFSPKAVAEATANDMGARTRLVELRVKSKVQVDILEDACKAIKSHVITEYSEEMAGYSNAEQRNALIERIQGTARTLIVEGTAMINLFDDIIKDIDASSFGISRLSEMIQVLDQSKGSKVI